MINWIDGKVFNMVRQNGRILSLVVPFLISLILLYIMYVMCFLYFFIEK